jgi:hypothetical protein
MIQGFIPGRSKKSLFSPHPASYSMGSGALSLMVKQKEQEADHSPPFDAEV